MAHVEVEAQVPYPCFKNGRQKVAAVGERFELHAFAARTAQRRRLVKIVGPSKTQLAAIKARAARLQQDATAEMKAAKKIGGDMAARMEQMEARLVASEERAAKAEAKAAKAEAKAAKTK